jgi:integrase
VKKNIRCGKCTMLHNKGVDPKIIQSQAGHSTVQITLDTYTHISMQQKKQTIVNIFDNDKKEKK